MLQTTDKPTEDEPQNTQTEKQNVSNSADSAGGAGGASESIKNLSTSVKLTKSKKPDLAKANFVKNNSFKTDFLIFKAKKAFMHLQKAFTKAPILRHFYSKYYIRIKTDISGYAISGVLCQMTLDQHFSNHVIHKGPNSEISQ